MVKATLRSAVLLGLLVCSGPSFAEVQNVKVGGDVTVRSFWRSNLDLTNNNGPTLNDDRFLMSTTGVNIGADLTENVSAFVRLANERNWNVDAGSTRDVAISQAYVTLKELFYSPLTVRIGAQPIVWGRGFVLGSNLIPGLINGGGDLHASISANEFTEFTAFDAIRATLDLSNVASLGVPLTLDSVYIKGNEGTIGVSDDVNIMGVNLGTKFDTMKSELETYYLNKHDRSMIGTSTSVTARAKVGSVSTIGIRGSIQPVEGALAYGELGYQFGRRATDPAGVLITGDAQQAWAFDLGLEYTAKEVAWTPKLGGEWIFFSGKNVDGAVTGWDPMARGYFTTALREFQNPTAAAFYPPSQNCLANGSSSTAGGVIRCTGSATNQHQLSVYGSLKPLEDLTVAPRLSWFVLDVGAIPVGVDGTRESKRKNYAGMEWDTQVTYNYTDDVQFGVIYGLFVPGNVYRNQNRNDAQELVTSVSVKF